MWAPGLWVLLGAVGTGSAQLLFNATKSVNLSTCNESAILPCIVNNLAFHSAGDMFVKWKFNGIEFFAFDGSSKKLHRSSNFSSANFASEKDLPKGIASLSILAAQARPGNYTCEVTESNREGEIVVELKISVGSWFRPVESAFIILFLFLAIIFSWAQLCVVASKFEIVLGKKVGLIITGSIIVIAGVVGAILLVPDGYTPKNRAGLGLLVVPAVIFLPLQYLLFGIVFDNHLRPSALVLVALKSLGYIITVVGFALCVSACPPAQGSVVIAGLAIMAFAALISLAFICIGSNTKDHQPPRKSVEEPLNESLVEGDGICYRDGDMWKRNTLVHTPWP
ncbi:PREDICTED: leukocyte surface antigen CD47 isoform X2 [Crocodylus porosus]|uniref:Leukocyte surface antigen CD47 n=1 Tax=Crocodylus porosus TaxID=8502 RepID=A0A7M4EU03_CROPO|nr:PREDICTED: leukocyte surface antigen CD47 isoform X2 [Crocodylus porosus]